MAFNSWMIGPIVGGLLFVLAMFLIIFCHCRARRNAMLMVQNQINNMQANQAMRMNNNMIQFKNINTNPTMGMETTSWGLNVPNNAHPVPFNNFGQDNRTSGVGNNYDPLNPHQDQFNQGFANNF